MWAIGSVSTDVVERVPGAFSRRGGQRGQCADGSSFDGVADEAAPLRWQDGVLLVLDQRRLPSEEAWVRCRTAEQVADCIRSMVVRGAPAIGLAAAYGMALAAQAGGGLEAAAAPIPPNPPAPAHPGGGVKPALAA